MPREHMQNLGEMSKALRGARRDTRLAMRSAPDASVVLEAALGDAHWASASVISLVERMPRWGQRRTANALMRAGISQFATVGHLTPRQRTALLAAVRDPEYRWRPDLGLTA